MKHYLYTDGQSQYRNFGKGCYSYILTNEYGDPLLNYTEVVENTSEPRMKLRAIIEGVRASKKATKELTVISSSEYVLNVLSGKWDAHKHQDLISEYLDVSTDMEISYEWQNSGWLFKRVNKQCRNKLEESLRLKDRILSNKKCIDRKLVKESFEDLLLSLGFAERPTEDHKSKTFYKNGGDLFGQPNFQTFVRVGDFGFKMDYYDKPHRKYGRALKWWEINGKDPKAVLTFDC